jgi:hypothetical protein
MAGEKPGFVNVDELMRQVIFEQAAAYYGVALPEIHRVGDEIRMRCFLNCGRSGETGERALAIQAEHAAKIWRCFEAGCGRGGNLVSLCDLMKPGERANGKPRGERFKSIIRDLQAMVVGTSQETSAAAESAPPVQAAKRPTGNLPLAQSENERARGLVTLDEKFVVDPAAMSPKAASYFRRRPFLTPEMCKRWRMGYLPRDAGGDHAGGTMRGKIVYPMLSESGEVLTWFGRDPEHEGKYQEWIAGGKQGKEPEKYHFVKGFQRGLELFGQHRFSDEAFRESARSTGLLVLAGPNDVMALDAFGVAAVGLCATSVTAEQAAKIGAFARETAGVATVLFDCTQEGELAARVALVELAQHCPVRLAWSPVMHDGAFRGRKADSLTSAEWERIQSFVDEPRGPGA